MVYRFIHIRSQIKGQGHNGQCSLRARVRSTVIIGLAPLLLH